MTRFLALLAALTLAFGAQATPAKKTNYFRVGNGADAQGISTTAGTVLMGGGTDVDAAFQWRCERANGGDQSNYVNYWTGTPVQSLLDAHIDAGRPVGGTSAGLAVLTQFVYSALAPQGATSSQALANPYNKYMTFARDFVSIDAVAGTIGDTHFVTRDRMGRTLGFLCRIHAEGWSAAPRAIAVDEETALLIDAAGSGTVVGNSAAYFITPPGAPETCQPRTPLTYTNVAVRKVTNGQTFDVLRWRGTAGTAYTVSATNGVLTSTQAGGSAY